MTTISEIYKIVHPKAYVSGKMTPYPAADPALLYGLELEIESVPNWDELVVSGMTSVEDGSLRNYGREFLTRPATLSATMFILNNFFKQQKFNEENYSERTSTHVHANCLDLTGEQLATVLLLYQTYERLFYAFVGKDRDSNVFCVPWGETRIAENIITKVLSGVQVGLHGWQKYTGLNILPLSKLGTIEFRHLSGTSDTSQIMDWLNLIGSLFAFARTHDFSKAKELVVPLNTTSQYRNITEMVFKDWARHFTEHRNFQEYIEDGVLNTKYCLLTLDSNKTISKPNLNNNVGIFDDHIIGQGAAEYPDWFVRHNVPLRRNLRQNPNRNIQGDFNNERN